MSEIEQAVSERIKFLFQHFGDGNLSAFARELNVSAQAIRDLMKGEKGGPSWPVLQNILHSFPSVSTDWLVLGRGPMLQGSADGKKKFSGQLGRFPVLSTQDNISIALITDRKLKNYFMRNDGPAPQEAIIYYEAEAYESIALPKTLIGDGRYIAFPVTNNMMEPLLMQGEFIICREVKLYNLKQINNGNIVIVLAKTQAFTIGRIGFEGNDSIIKISFDNVIWNDILLNVSDIHEIWEFKWSLSPHANKLIDDSSTKQLVKALQLRFEEVNNKVERVFGGFRQRLKEIILDYNLQNNIWAGDHTDLANDKEVYRLFISEHGPITNHQKYLDDMVVIIDSIIREINEDPAGKPKNHLG